MLYQLDKRHNLVCSMIFGYSHLQCKDMNPKLYDEAYRKRLHKEFEAYEPEQTYWSLNQGTSLALITLFLVSFIFALKDVIKKRLCSFDTQESRDFQGLSWFNPQSSMRKEGVKRDFVPRYCERITPEEFEYQSMVLTKREVNKLVNSDGYQLFAQIKGNNPADWNWQIRDRQLGIYPPSSSSASATEYEESKTSSYIQYPPGTRIVASVQPKKQEYDLGKEIAKIDSELLLDQKQYQPEQKLF